MKKILLLLLSFFCVTQISQSQETENYPNKIVVKLKSGTISTLDNSTNQYISDILGDISYRNIIHENLIKRYIADRNLLYANILNEAIISRGLERIFILDYTSGVNPLIASRKISDLAMIEYAEPLYIRKIASLPNDSLLLEQYLLPLVGVIDSWEITERTAGDTVVVAIVDTGVDYTHEDLLGTLYINPGENGLDDNGNDKRTNEIDDDGNGFVDDWRGWDFGSSTDDSGFDNDPMPGNPHGTHVAGIVAAIRNNEIGIAGIYDRVKIMPVKIAYDSPFSRTLVNAYDGLMYAAMNGADVINCSWGGGGFSQAEQELIDVALSYGCVIVAAAGNNSTETAFYPASYKGIISVASTDQTDRKSNFSNYHSSIDLSAPGTKIMSTIPINTYVAWDGTSMASPIVAACAAVIKSIYTNYTNSEIGEVLKATADNIYEKNQFLKGKLGAGRVNLYNALTVENPKWVSLYSQKVIDEDGDGMILPGDLVSIELSLINNLVDVDSVYIKAFVEKHNAELLTDSVWVGKVNKNTLLEIPQKNRLRIPHEIPVNHRFNVEFHIKSDRNFTNINSIEIVANPSWRTLKTDILQATVTSQGNIAFNDFPYNMMGEGFSWRGSSNLLFEGALMIAADTTKIANTARGALQNMASRSFEVVEKIDFKSKTNELQHTFTSFREKLDTAMVGVAVLNSSYIINSETLQNVLILNYDVINNSEQYRDSLFVGMYFDWDIGPGGANNKAVWDYDHSFGYTYNVNDDTYPKTAVKIMNQGAVNYFAIDNNGNTEENPGVYDGFTDKEKWFMMTNGIARDESGIKDVSMVISSGPHRARANDTLRVTFAIFAEQSHENLKIVSNNLEKYLPTKINPDGEYNSRPTKSRINRVYPNPSSGEYINLEFAVTESKLIKFDLIDLNGKHIKDILTIYGNKLSENYLYGFNLQEIAIGKYFLRMHVDGEINIYPIVIER